MTEHTDEPTSGGNHIRPPGDVNPRTDPPLDFPDRELDDLGAADYAALGFMAGLEVHQQLATRSKLFCRCPCGRRDTGYDAEVLRHMRPTLSELGEYDGTALMEFKTRKEIVYRLVRRTVCTYEIDDTPPFPIDDEAVRYALEIAMLCNLNLVSELHVMRKQYLDGSIPTGFQRTAMVGLTGRVPFHVPALGIDRDLGIRQLSLEEDSCREVSDVGHRITFKTDRLGMPLTEVVTEPELLTPWELQAAGHLIAAIARSTGKVLRGPGAARQDVNVSVAGGRRVEIKGVYHHRGLPRLVHLEAFRQLNLLRVRAELVRRGVAVDQLAVPDTGMPWEHSPLVVEAAPLLGTPRAAPLREALDRGERLVAVRLPGFAGLLGHRTQPGRTFAYEIAERVRVIACPTHRPVLAHSDDPEAAVPWDTLRSALHAERGDAVVLVWGTTDDAATAAREVLIRAQDAVIGVPAETRQAHADGTTGFERILPGPDRMYPDTDTPPLPIRDAVVETIRVHLPERPWERERRYRAWGLGPAAAQRVARAPWAGLFDAVAPAPGETARRVAAALAKRLPFHGRRGRPVPDAARLAAAVRAIEDGGVRPEALDRLIDRLVLEPQAPVDAVLEAFRRSDADQDALARRLADVAARAAAPAGRSRDAALRWALGEVVPSFLGRIDPAEIRRQLEHRLAAPLAEEVA